MIARRTRAGYGANHNLALARAEGRHVLFLNDDAQRAPGRDRRDGGLPRRPSRRRRRGADARALRRQPGRSRCGRRRRRGPTCWRRCGSAAAARRCSTGERPQPVGWAMGCALLVAPRRRARGRRLRRGLLHVLRGGRPLRAARGRGRRDALGARGRGRPRRAGHHGRLARARDRDGPLAPPLPAAPLLAARAAASRGAGICAQFAALALAALLRRRPARPFALQVVGAWREPGAPGLRERAEAFNRALPPA